MPTYDYVCEDCEHAFEEFQSITADALRVCPQCKKSKLRRLIGGGAAILFKGSGFYETDYRSESYKKDAAKHEAGTSDEAKPKSSDDSKPPEKKNESPAPAKKDPTPPQKDKKSDKD